MKTFWLGISLCLAGWLSSSAQADTLSEVQKRGYLKCGVSQGLPGFSSPDKSGQWHGIDVDYCRALAVAVLGDASKVKYSPLSAKERLTALQSGEIDILSRNTTWTFQRDTQLGINFVGVVYYDGQGFMVPKELRVNHAQELGGATICVSIGTTTEMNLSDFFRGKNLKYKLVTFEKIDEVVAAYDAGRCDAISTDKSGLYALRTRLRKPEEHLILPENLSKEPLGPAVRQGDDRWQDIARWTLFALFEGEELGVGSKQVDGLQTSSLPAIRRFFGSDVNLGENLGLKADWAAQIIRQVGNYGEIFDRNLGQHSILKIERGLNALWNAGGLHYPMPFR